MFDMFPILLYHAFEVRMPFIDAFHDERILVGEIVEASVCAH